MGFLKKLKNKESRKIRIEKSKEKKKELVEKKKKRYLNENIDKNLSEYTEGSLLKIQALALRSVYHVLKYRPDTLVSISKEVRFLSSCLHDEQDGLGIRDFVEHLKEESGYLVSISCDNHTEGNTDREVNTLDRDVQKEKDGIYQRCFDYSIVATLWVLHDKHGVDKYNLDKIYSLVKEYSKEYRNKDYTLGMLVEEIY